MAVSGALTPIVIVAVFNKPPTVGWMLYYYGRKRTPVISKYGSRTRIAAAALASDALAYLAPDLKSESEPVNVRIINASNGASIDGIKPLLLAPFIVRETAPPAEDLDVLAYLFGRAPHQVMRRQRERPPLPVAGPAPVPVSESTAVAAADASYKSALDNGGIHAAGTGWVIEYRNECGKALVETGSRRYEDGEHGHGLSSNSLEVCALRDALQHMKPLLDTKLSGVSHIILYSDSTFAVRSLVERNLTLPVSEVLEQIHGLIFDFAEKGVGVEYLWTKGHADNKWNLMAHKMADVGRMG